MLASCDVCLLTNEENDMSTYDDKKDAQGRSWDQITKNGTSSAGSMGVGGTGDSGKLDHTASQQSDTRTDDLLDDGSSQEGQAGFQSSGGRVDTGLEGMGKQGGTQGNKQSATPAQDGGQSQDQGQQKR
jgi:hypothetical protein